ncbi:MAG: prolyl oligopeptidase family serine peptidase [Vicinamibacterales bacterium]
MAHTNRLRRAVSRPVLLLAGLAAVLAATSTVPQARSAPAQASQKKVLTVDDYTRWRSISGAEISPDGRWVSYSLQFTNVPQDETKPVLHLRNLDTNQEVEVANATGGTFSKDSKWIAYQVDPGGRGGRGGRGRAGGGGGAAQVGGQGGQNARGGRGQTPAEPRRVELRNLATGEVAKWQDIQTFAFNATSTHLFLKRRAAQGSGGGAAGRGGGGGGAQGGNGGNAGNGPAGPRGVDVIVRDLGTGRDLLLGNVADVDFDKSGELLAYTVDAAVKDGNGLFALELGSGRIIPLDNDAKVYNRLTWSDDGKALAVLKGNDVDEMRERANLLVAFPDVRAAIATPGTAPVVLDPASADGFPEDWVVSDRAALSWSDDDQRVFFGMKAQVPEPDTSNERPDRDEVADVDVWNSRDERIQSVQMIRADADRNFTYRQAFDVANHKYVKLADESMRDLDVAPDGRWAVGRDARSYVSDYGPNRADFYRVNTTTGERTLMFKEQIAGAHAPGFSPDGKHYLYWKDSKYQVYDLDAARARAIGGSGGPDFTDMEFDHFGPRPPYGIQGYTKDGSAVVAESRYDLWAVPLDGSAPKNITGGLGAKNETEFRYIDIEPDEGGGGGGGLGRGGGAGRREIDLSKPVLLSAYGQWTKKSGFYRLEGGQMKSLVYDDASFSTPTKAEKADKFLFTRQTFVEFPDLQVSGPDFTDARKISDANPQQAEYRWGHRILFDFKNKAGVRLQGILALPDDYQPGEKRPMLVTFYEKNSQNLHRYSAPSYLTGMGASPIQAVSEGYITMLPDIHFNVGSSHSDMLECVEAAVKKVIEMGYVDPARIAVSGHSYGGEGAAFIGTRSKLFAAVGVGAGVTDLYSDFSQSWGWSYQISGGSGANGNDYYLYGQGRWGFTPWDKPETYLFESALSHVTEAPAPFLIMHGTADPTVSFSEGMNFYNALRYAGKNAILLAYPGEGHGLRGLANRKDLTIRYFQFFDHYLKGEPAPAWMTDGVPYLEKDQNRDPRGGGGRGGGGGGGQ